MGVIDAGPLFKIKYAALKYCKDNDLPFRFKIDLGTFETAIEFHTFGYYHPPRSKSWDECKAEGNEIKCPDLLDWYNRLIIEYEEEPKPGKPSGKLGKKGHTEESEKDSHRDMLYRIAGFKVLKIWESEFKSNSYLQKLSSFFDELT